MRCVGISVAIALSLVASSATAATLRVTQGSAAINRGQGVEPVNATTTVNPGDTVTIQPGGSAEIVYPDGSIQPVQPDRSYLEFRLPNLCNGPADRNGHEQTDGGALRHRPLFSVIILPPEGELPKPR